VPLDSDGLADTLPEQGVPVDERAERDERTARSVEALGRLKPDERKALLLKAQGLSYREISDRLGWTYTKVNRAITEGRRRFLGVFASIESGSECERFAPTLLALAQGAAQADDVLALRPHLRHCACCRATVRELHASRRHRLALHIPLLAGAAPLRWLGERIPDGPPSRPLLQGLLQRVSASDAITSVQLASSGGGRGTVVAALVGLCLGGGAGTYCLTTGTFPDPTRLVQSSEEPRRPRAERRRAARYEEPAAAAPATAEVANIVTRRPPAPTATPTPARPSPNPRDKSKRRSTPQPEFGFESTTESGSGAAPATPIATPASKPPPPESGGGSTASSSPPPTSGGEFLP
jgi:DNA-binding CsgD family transcriptional regulator